jgi:hypothetical protein
VGYRQFRLDRGVELVWRLAEREGITESTLVKELLEVHSASDASLAVKIVDMDSSCSYGIGCARLKTVVRSITEQGESR